MKFKLLTLAFILAPTAVLADYVFLEKPNGQIIRLHAGDLVRTEAVNLVISEEMKVEGNYWDGDVKVFTKGEYNFSDPNLFKSYKAKSIFDTSGGEGEGGGNGGTEGGGTGGGNGGTEGGGNGGGNGGTEGGGTGGDGDFVPEKPDPSLVPVPLDGIDCFADLHARYNINAFRVALFPDYSRVTLRVKATNTHPERTTYYFGQKYQASAWLNRTYPSFSSFTDKDGHSSLTQEFITVPYSQSFNFEMTIALDGDDDFNLRLYSARPGSYSPMGLGSDFIRITDVTARCAK